MKMDSNITVEEVKQKMKDGVNGLNMMYQSTLIQNNDKAVIIEGSRRSELKVSKPKFSEKDFITLFLTKLYENGITKIDTMQLKHDLSEFYLNEEYSILFDDISLKEQIEGSFLELDDALLFAQFLGLLSNPIQGTTERVIWRNNFAQCTNYPEEYINKMNELVNEYKLKFCTSKFEKAKLNYMSAVSKTTPVDTIPVSGSKLVELDLSIKEKCRQNHLNDSNLENDDIYYSRSTAKQEQGPVRKLIKK